MLNEPGKLTENLLGISWQDSAWIPILNIHNVMDYFSERSNPFYDRTCNNEVLKMQRASPDQLTTLQGVEYCLLHVQEPILYVIRKQQRHSPTQVTPISDYYIVAGTVYQAPDLSSVLNSRLLTAVTHLQSAFEEARHFAKYHPSRGYWWDFGSNKMMSESEKLKEELEKKKKNKKKKKKDKKAEQEKRVREEPSSLFQRRRVDMLLDLLTKRFPPKLTPPQAAPGTQAANVASIEKDTKDEIKSEKDGNAGTTAASSVKSEKIDTQSLKREAPATASSSLSAKGNETKKIKLSQ